MNYTDDKPKRKRSPLHLRRVRLILAALMVGLLAVLPFIGQALWEAAPDVNIAGLWYGRSYQESGGIYPEYAFQMQIQQEGSVISGTTYVVMPGDSSMFASMTFSGSIDQGVITFHENGILRQQHPPRLYWCMKTAHLTLNNDTLIGTFTAPQCAPGKIELKKAGEPQ